MLQLSNRGSVATCNATAICPHNKGTVTFGYWTNGDNFEFGVYSDAYSGNITLTVLQNKGGTVAKYLDQTTAPSG